MYKVALINIWFGESFPSYFDFFCKSCIINKNNFNWFIFTNLTNVFKKINDAVFLIPYSWKKLIFDFNLNEDINLLKNSSAWETVGSWPKGAHPYRMLLFKKDWSGYDFVGTSDLDVIFGDLSKFIKNDIFDYGMITAHSGKKTPSGKIRNCCPFSFYNKKSIEKIWKYRELSEIAKDDNYEFSEYFLSKDKIYAPKNLQPIGDSLFMGEGMLEYKCIWNNGRIFVQGIEGGMFHLSPYKYKDFEVCPSTLQFKYWNISKYGIKKLSLSKCALI